MKKLISLLLSLTMLGLLCACANSKLGIDVDNTSSQSTTKSSSTSKDNSTGTTKYSSVTEDTMPSGTPIKVTTDKNGKPVNSNYEGSIGKILKGGKFTMSGNIQMEMKEGTQATPVTLHVSGKKMAIELKTAELGSILGSSSSDMKSVWLINTGKDIYIYIPNFTIGDKIKDENVYYKVTENDGSLGMINISDIFNGNNKKYINTTKVTYKGQTYVCEAYKSDEGTTKYYFNGGKLKRIESVDSSGAIFILENINFTTTVDESLFTLPKESHDIASLIKLFGGSLS